MKKRLLAAVVTGVLLTGALAGCGSTAKTETKDDANTETTGELEPLTVAASETPHSEILEQAKAALAEKGYDLQVTVFDDYIQPNAVVESGEIDANYFQHLPYLEWYNEENGSDLVSVAKIHYEPFGLYGNGVASVADVKEGATIVIPADDSNETRALLLLKQEGLIDLPEGANATDGVTTLDITDNHGYNIVTVQADTVAAQFNNSDEGSLAVINGNYALAAGLSSSDALAVEDASGDAAQTYANVIAVRNGDENNAKTQALIKALETDDVKNFIDETYKGAVVAIF